MRDIFRIYCAGYVQRYHTNAWLARFGQTNADHQGRCVQLLLLLFPDASSQLIRAMAFHDVGEVLSGDLPAGIGRRYRTLKDSHKEADAHARSIMLREYGGDPVQDTKLSSHEMKIATFVDQLEALLFMLTRMPQARHHDGWPQSIKNLQEVAGDLGLKISIHDFLVEASGGNLSPL